MILAVAAALALWFIFTAAFHYVTYTQAAYGPLWPRRAALIPHILGGVVAITTGLVQVWLVSRDARGGCIFFWDAPIWVR